jgi:hypothetical protein
MSAPALPSSAAAPSAWWRRLFAPRRRDLPASLADAIASEVEAIALACRFEALAANPNIASDLGFEQVEERRRAREARRTPPSL